jgi:hypothetical protein
MKIQPTWISRSFLVLVCAIMASGTATAEEPKPIDGRELYIQLATAGYYSLVKQMRAAAILIACDKTGLADTVGPTHEEQEGALFKALSKMRADPQTAVAVEKLNSHDTAVLLVAADYELQGYVHGFRDAMVIARPNLPSLCETGMKLADDILKEKKVGK